MFSLGGGGCANDTLVGGGRANDTTQGGRIDGNMGATMGQRQNLAGSMSNEWDDASIPLRDDPSAPNVGVRFRETGEYTTGDLVGADNVFVLGGGGQTAQRHLYPRSKLHSGPRSHRTNHNRTVVLTHPWDHLTRY